MAQHAEVHPSLTKLQALKEDDKTECAMLRSRIDEQSRLIMILKQRADEATGKQGTLERINAELMEFREQATEKLEYEMRRFDMLDQRFHDLASNHEEMIKYKDEYKRVNQQLRAENTRLKQENEALFSKALLEKDAEIEELVKKCTTLKDEYLQLDLRFRNLQQDSRSKEEGLKIEISQLQDSYGKDMKRLQSTVDDLEERLKGAKHKIQCLSESQRSADSDSQNKLQVLSKERDELLELTMQRGKLIQKEQTENKRLQKLIEEKEQAVKRMEEKFERESAAVNANQQVRKLQEQVRQTSQKNTDMVKEFEAFKKHANSMLQKERELNERLRHLAG
ncbi:coiled-coil domain-containing protein 89-like [Liolophura sinensis]|uniref:coiled-coil domain-containing protein 89-like n=1 Tax=Liolophura sinensis TaxID=3198878 RepID=UPI003158C25D